MAIYLFPEIDFSVHKIRKSKFVPALFHLTVVFSKCWGFNGAIYINAELFKIQRDKVVYTWRLRFHGNQSLSLSRHDTP